MQPRGQFPEPPRTPLGSHLHPVLIPSLRSWRCCLVQSRKQRLSLSPRWEPLPWGRQVQAGLACPSAGNVARAARAMEPVLPVFHN